MKNVRTREFCFRRKLGAAAAPPHTDESCLVFVHHRSRFLHLPVRLSVCPIARLSARPLAGASVLHFVGLRVKTFDWLVFVLAACQSAGDQWPAWATGRRPSGRVREIQSALGRSFARSISDR